jgi:hypothetical protein
MEDFYFFHRFHGNRGAACREVHTNFANESECLMADSVRNDVVTIHRSHEVSKMSVYSQIPFAINCFVKKHYNKPSCAYITLDTKFHWMERDFMD